MSIATRPFADPRNTYIVENNDPGAYDKSHLGTPGTHTEQRCCGDAAPYTTGNTIVIRFLINDKGERRPIGSAVMPEEARQGWRETSEVVPDTTLWCKECKTALEEFWDEAQKALGEMAPVIRGIAIAVSYVPVFGTAISFSINMSLTLAEGGNINEAVLDGVGGALPGQPASGMAFNAARSIIKGNRIDKIAIDTLPVDPSAKTAITAAVSIVEDLASGKKLNDTATYAIYTALPAEGKKAMDVARRMASGESIDDVFLSEAEAATNAAMHAAADYARTQGEEAVNRFIAESGYQGTMDMIPPELGNGLKAGILAGLIESRQIDIAVASQGSFDFSEKNVAENDRYADMGRKIINTGAKWKGRLLSDICSGNSFTISHDVMNGLTGQTERRKATYEINDLWRRGFEVAIGLCEGSSVEDDLQKKIGISLVGHTKGGFNAGQEIQFDRTNPLRLLVRHTVVPIASQIQRLAREKPPGWAESVPTPYPVGRQAEGADKGAIEGAIAGGVQAAGLDTPNSNRLKRAWFSKHIKADK